MASKETVSPENPLFNQLTKDTLSRYKDRELFIDSQGKEQPYLLANAVRDAIESVEEQGLTPLEIFTIIQRQTHIAPVDTPDLDAIHEAQDWNEFLRDTCRAMVAAGIYESLSDADMLDNQRMQMVQKRRMTG